MKFMNMKRFGATVMAGALALSLAAPAFAASTTINGGFEAVDTTVTVTNTGTAIINPYGLPIDLTHPEGSGASATDEVDATISGEQITTAAPLTIVNGSAVAMAVSATVTGSVPTGSGVVLVEDITAGVTDTTTPKNVAAKFEAFPAPGIDGGTIADLTSTTDNDKYAAQAALNEAFSELKSEDAVLTAPVLTTASTAEGSLILREGDDDGVAQYGGVAFFRLSGEVVKNPTTAWAEADSNASPAVVGDIFTATIAFTFEPSEYVGQVELSAVESVAVNGTATITATLPDGVSYARWDTIKWTSSKETTVSVVDASTKLVADTTSNPNLPERATEIKGTLTGVKSGSTKATITLEFVGNDGVTYRGTTQVKCS